jgi:uncharacterized integral membrane protein
VTTPTAPGAASGEPRYEGTGILPAVVAGLVLGAAAVIFVAQNTKTVALHFLWLDFRTSPAVLVLATALLVVAASVIAGAMIRRRRRRLLQERQELERLRSVVDVTGGEAPDASDATGTPGTEEPSAVDMGREAPRTMRE